MTAVRRLSGRVVSDAIAAHLSGWDTSVDSLGDGYGAEWAVRNDELLLGSATHTWPRLSDSKLAEFQRGIKIASLPIALQESIDFLTRLSIQGTPITYIWIDSFCIVQDGPTSAADWRAECGRMADVYSHSVLNLSLSLSNHSGQSCLSLPENEESCAILLFEWTDPTTEERYTVISAQYSAAALYDQPLSHRAWVLQERLLAP